MTRQPKASGRKSLIGEGRSEASYRRQPGQLPGSRIILIVCEGKETEPRNFKAIRNEHHLLTLRIEVVPGGDGRGSPKAILQTAQEKQEELNLSSANGDQTWCVFDTEQQGTYPDLDALLARATKQSLGLAVSNPSFEYWYLLHFECTDRPFQRAAEVVERLRNHLPNYTKSMNAFECLRGRTETALANASALRRRADQDWAGCPNPSTGVDKLVQQIWNLSESAQAAPSCRRPR